MNIAILGFDRQGKDAYEHWNKPGNTITICDRNTQISAPEGTKTCLGDKYLRNLHAYDLILRTPGLHPNDIAKANAEYPEVMNKVWTVTNEFFKVCPSKNIIGVTGTKGKGTTSTLIAKMLEAAGETVHLGGNIGISPLQLLKNNIQPNDWVVLELANFQLIDLKFSPSLAICLMVEPEHMDWHSDMNEYIAAKQQLFVHQKSNDVAIHYAENQNSKIVTVVSGGQHIPYAQQPGALVTGGAITINDKTICKTSELKLLGKHNWQNVCAAITAAWQVTQNIEALRSVATSFTGLPFRIEHIANVNGVDYYNDSFGTTPETTQVAIEAIEAPKIAILGGSDKGSNYDKLAETIAVNNVRMVVLIGEMALSIEKALNNVGYVQTVEGGDNIDAIVQTATKYAQPGDAILLSTACASFDMFKNYQDRGEQFNQAVQALA